MIIFSKVLADRGTVWDAIRAREVACAEAPDDLIRFSSEVKPVVMWNITRECNLSCKHCYMDARSPHPDEWTLDEGIRFIDEMARLEMPMLIVTGGEPLMSKNFFPFAFHAKEKGVRMVISTNGTLITPEVAVLLAEADIRYVGVSVDAATAEMHDAFRGVAGAFDRAMEGIKNAQDAGLKTGLRITIQKENWQEVPKLLDLCVEKEIPRFCLYHLVPTGRGKHIMEELDVTKEERTQVLKYLYDSAINLRDKEIEILTTDSPMDGVYILERLKREDPERFDQVRDLLQVSGGCSIGNKVANVDYLGNVNPCHFTPQMTVGNVKERSFDEIWNGNPGEQLLEIRERRTTLDGT
ncbi:MAG: radical SAM protein, partial [Euryarchaeota archaeon]|nr:radical SAM protein [Euryarchaeota archaeon]